MVGVMSYLVVVRTPAGAKRRWTRCDRRRAANAPLVWLSVARAFIHPFPREKIKKVTRQGEFFFGAKQSVLTVAVGILPAVEGARPAARKKGREFSTDDESSNLSRLP